MSAAALPPTAPTTLVILLGASAWPNSPGFQASEAFTHAAQGFKDFALDPQGFGLPAANLFDLFDAQTSASDQLEMLGSFLEQRAQTLKAADQAVRDVLVYFVGHGGFAGPSADFYLLHRRANASSLRATGIAIDALAEVLREKARQARRYLFLDCCFAAAAFRAFQGGPDQIAITKTMDAFQVQARSNGFPGKGTVLLCSSDQKSPSLLLPDESCTMFSHALLDVLRKGDPHRPRQLSLRDIKELAEDRLDTLPEKNAPRPGLYSPDQSEGDVADIPFFPNPYVERERVRLAEEERRRQAEQARKVEEEKRRRLEEERTRKAEEEQARQAEEERRRRAEQAERVRPAMEKRVQNIAEQAPPMPSQTFPSPSSPQLYSPLITRRNVLLLGLAGAGLTATGIGIGWWEFAHRSPVSPGIPTPEPTTTPTPITYPRLAQKYSGTVANSTDPINERMYLKNIRQTQGTIEGLFGVVPVYGVIPLLCGNGPFTGTITPEGKIQFKVTHTDCNNSRALSFTGQRQQDGSIGGNYTVPSTGEGGIWSVRPG